MNADAENGDEIATIRIELVGSSPVIWREVEVPVSVTLADLHEIVQGAMGWLDGHLWEFTVAGRRYGLPMDEDWGTEPRAVAASVALRDVLRPRRTTLTYLYDFGDDWEHRLTVTDVRPGRPRVSYPRHVGGEWNGPPEDCGGIPGFYGMLDILGDPEHPDHAEIKEWLAGYDPEVVDEARIKAALSRIARRLKRARVRRPKPGG